MADQVATDYFPKTDDNSARVIGWKCRTHQHQHVRPRQVHGTPAASAGADGIGIGRPCQVLPAAGDSDEVIGPSAQLSDVVDEKVTGELAGETAPQARPARANCSIN